MRKDNERSPKIDRRRLLTGAGFAIGAAGASAVSTTAPATASEQAKPQHNGYRETEEVKTYYSLVRF